MHACMHVYTYIHIYTHIPKLRHSVKLLTEETFKAWSHAKLRKELQVSSLSRNLATANHKRDSSEWRHATTASPANQPPGFPRPPEENNRSVITSTWMQVNKQISILLSWSNYKLVRFKSKDSKVLCLWLPQVEFWNSKRVLDLNFLQTK